MAGSAAALGWIDRAGRCVRAARYSAARWVPRWQAAEVAAAALGWIDRAGRCVPVERYSAAEDSSPDSRVRNTEAGCYRSAFPVGLNPLPPVCPGALASLEVALPERLPVAAGPLQF